MEFQLLGPVEVAVGGRSWDVGPPQRRTILAILAATPGVYVPTDLMVDRVWGEGATVSGTPGPAGAPEPAARPACRGLGQQSGSPATGATV